MIICDLLTNWIFDSIYQRGYYSANYFTFGLAFVAGAIIVGASGFLIQALSKEKIYIDKETGEEVMMGARHNFFFVPVVYWGPIFLVIALVLFVMEIIY